MTKEDRLELIKNLKYSRSIGVITDEDADEIIKALEQTRWIPVENGLPEPGEMVLVSCRAKNGRSSVNRAYMDNNCFWHGSGSMSGVIAWQKLPEPYSEE